MSNGGFTQVENAALERIQEVGVMAFAVYAILLRYADNETRDCFPGQESIGRAIGVTTRTVRDAINTLIDAGWIEVIRNKGRGNKYFILPQSDRKNSSAPSQSDRKPISSTPEGDFRTTGSQLPMTPEASFRLTIPNEKDSLTTPKTKTKRRKAAEVVEIPIPDVLISDEFQTAWAAWNQHRKEKKKELTATSTRLQFKELEEWGPQRAIAAIEHSIKKGWIGIFEPNGDTKNGNGKHYTPGPGQRHPNDAARDRFART